MFQGLRAPLGAMRCSHRQTIRHQFCSKRSKVLSIGHRATDNKVPAGMAEAKHHSHIIALSNTHTWFQKITQLA